MKQEILEQEKKYLNKVLNEITKQKQQKGLELTVLGKEKKEFSSYYSEDFYHMDDEEAAGTSDMMGDIELAENRARATRERRAQLS